MHLIPFHYCLALFGIALCLGCGAQSYEQRLGETAKYYEYRNRIDAALDQRAWLGSGVEFRPLKGFNEIPAPAEGESDARQPSFLKQPLKGLIGAWQAELKVDIPNSDIATKPAWLLLCNNHQAWIERETNINIVPMNYLADFADQLAFNFDFKRHTPTNPWTFTEERVPKGIAYVPFKSFDYATLDTQHDGITYDVVFYRYNVKDIQLALVVIAPQALDRREKVYDKMFLLMEHLTLSGDVPKSVAKKKVVSGGGL